MLSETILRRYSTLAAQQLVWKSMPSFEKAATIGESYTLGESEKKKDIWGVSANSDDSGLFFVFYVAKDFEIERMRSSLRKNKIRAKFIRTSGFFSLQSKRLQPVVVSGNPARNSGLNGWGTLGGYVSDNLSNLRLGISNNHVFGLLNRASLNDKIEFDTGGGVIDIGGFHRMVNLQSPPQINTIDAAVCWLHEDFKFRWARKKPSRSVRPTMGMEVYKIGQRTAYTEGFVTSLNLNHKVSYRGAGTLNFSNSIEIIGKSGFPFSLPGDSGSLVFKKSSHEVVGLIFAGDGTLSFANSFKNIESQLQISISK